MTEKRDSVRHKVDEECLVTLNGIEIFCRLLNLSASGIGIVV